MTQPLKVYLDYNLLGRLLDQRRGSLAPCNDRRWLPDHHALAELYSRFLRKEIILTLCREDALEEFVAYCPERIESYDVIRDRLPEDMKLKFDLFQGIEPGELLIVPWGEYGYGCGPFGDGHEARYDLLDMIRQAVKQPSPSSPKADRDARHLMHSILYGCDFFVTMDYRTIVNRLNPLPASLRAYLDARGLSLNVVTPAALIAIVDRAGIRPEG